MDDRCRNCSNTGGGTLLTAAQIDQEELLMELVMMGPPIEDAVSINENMVPLINSHWPL